MKHEPRRAPEPPRQSHQPAGGVFAPAPPTSALAGHSYAAGQTLQSLQAAASGQPHAATPSSLDTAADGLRAAHGADLAALAAAGRVPEAGLAAILLAEGHFLPPRVDERMSVRFEPYPFWLATGRWLVDSHKDQPTEYRALREAEAIDPAAARQSTRMGLGQVRGGEAEAAGYATAAAMWTALEASPSAQVAALGRVVAADPALSAALCSEDWRAVAAIRSGPAAGVLGYEDALAAFASAYAGSARVGPEAGDDDPEDGRKPRRSAKPRKR